MSLTARSPNRLVAPLAIVAVVALLYGHTLQVPFYLDDQWNIVDNYLLRDLAATVRRLFSQRGLSNLTFALNYRLTGWALPPLHLTNLALHAGCGVLVWLLLRRWLAATWLPLLGALLFVAHPLQTQAVTYLVQRATVLAAFCFLLALWLYLRAQSVLAAGGERRSTAYLRPYLGAVLAGLAALLAKENTATLPLVLLVCDRLLAPTLTRTFRQAVCDYLPFALAPLWLGVVMFNSVTTAGAQVLYVTLDSLRHNDPLHYLVTEFKVLWVYLRLVVFPLGQALEHGFPVTAELMSLPNLLALAGLLGIGWLGWHWRRQRPLAAFGVAWFFLTLAVESSFIPLDPLFEHRLYLPLFGVLLVLLESLALWRGSVRRLLVLGALVLVCAPLTWQRNALWNDPIALYEDNLRRKPGSERAGETLATLYGQAGRFVDERRLLEALLRDFPQNPVVRDNLARSYAEENRWADAYALLAEGIKLQPETVDFYATAATMASRQGNMPAALAYLRQGLAVPNADRIRLWNELGIHYAAAGQSELAVAAFRSSLALNPDHPFTCRQLGRELYRRGEWAEAVTILRRALKQEPGHPESLELLGGAALRLGDRATADWAAGKLFHNDRPAWQRLQIEIANLSPERAQ